MIKRSTLVALLLVLAALVPSTVSAATIDDIIALTKAGVSDAVLLALIDRDKSVFAIEANELVALKGAGVSEAVVVAMLKSGRDSVPAAPPAPAPPYPQYPNFVVVGHGPDRPNTSGQWDGFPWSTRTSDGFPLPTMSVLPYVIVGSRTMNAGCVGINAGGTKPVLSGQQLGRLSTDLGTRSLASGVGRIVNNSAVSTVTDTQIPVVVVGCQQTAPSTGFRSRR